ncbi:hypothetical protein [Microbacterium sp. A84]|uniref:hypothetical protein n=1 Tax=Microbacterium sp. A84 TaxID=3450715 RepID=UPI003F42ACF6
MPLLLKDRAVVVSPLALVTTAEARMLHIVLTPTVWRRLRRGIYVNRAAYEKLLPWTKYSVRVHAFARLHPDAALCLESAAVPHGLPHFGQTEYIHVYDPHRSRSRKFGDVFVHTSIEQREVGRIGGVLTTSFLDTVIDLCRVLPPAHALTIADSAISPVQGGLLTLDQLRAESETQENRRGRSLLRWVWARADGLSESPSESVSRAVIEWSGFEQPELQRKFHYEGELDRTDFFFPSNGAIGEADGWEKYQLKDPKKAAVLLADEKRREDRLRRNGHPFARWEFAGARKVKPLVEALLAAKVRRIAPPQMRMLKTLSINPRAVPPPTSRP